MSPVLGGRTTIAGRLRDTYPSHHETVLSHGERLPCCHLTDMSSEPAPRQPLQERVGAAILAGAAEALAADGDASMSAIARASGVARATVYRYFPSREAL